MAPNSNILDNALSKVNNENVDNTGNADFDDTSIFVSGSPNTSGVPNYLSGNFNKQNVMTVGQLKQSVEELFATKDPSSKAIAQNLYKAGFISKSQRDTGLSVAKYGVGNAAAMYAAYTRVEGSRSVSFEDWLPWYANSQPDPDEGGGSGGGGYTGPTTSTSVSITDSEDVSRSLNTFAVDMLGRNLTDRELKKYSKAYTAAEKDSPQVTVSTPGVGSNESVTEQTVTRDTIAKNILQDSPAFADNVIKSDVLEMFFNRLGGNTGG